MKPWVWLAACLSVLAAVVVAVGCPHAFGLFPGGRGALDLSGALRQLEAERRRSGELDAELAAARRYVRLLNEIAAAVVSRRLTLLEAAARFRALAEQAPAFNWDDFRRTKPGGSDAERHCRAVIGRVGAILAARPAEAAQVVLELESELQRHLERDGTVYLPEPTP